MMSTRYWLAFNKPIASSPDEATFDVKPPSLRVSSIIFWIEASSSTTKTTTGSSMATSRASMGRYAVARDRFQPHTIKQIKQTRLRNRDRCGIVADDHEIASR